MSGRVVACVAALFWRRVSVLLILESLERNTREKTRKNKKGERKGRGEKFFLDFLKLIRHSASPKIAPLRRLDGWPMTLTMTIRIRSPVVVWGVYIVFAWENCK